MPKPTLYEQVLHSGGKTKGRMRVAFGRSKIDQEVNAQMAHGIRAAVPFVIDDDTVRLACAFREDAMFDPTFDLPEAALVPFECTWIEYDPRAKLAPYRVTPETASRFAHLVFREPGGVSVMSVESFRKHEFFVSPYVMNWCSPGRIAPVRRYMSHQFTENAEHAQKFRSMLLTGRPGGPLPSWYERFGGDTYQPAPGDAGHALEIHRGFDSLFQEHGSVASLLMGLLTVMAHCPRADRVMQPTGRWIGKGGSTHPHHRHTIVRIETSPRLVYRQVQNAVREAIRRAEHDVREHWRTVRRGKPDEYRVKIRQHKRGDPAIGVITHDHYETTRIDRS